jgi:hypothetical protein
MTHGIDGDRPANGPQPAATGTPGVGTRAAAAAGAGTGTVGIPRAPRGLPAATALSTARTALPTPHPPRTGGGGGASTVATYRRVPHG